MGGKGGEGLERRRHEEGASPGLRQTLLQDGLMGEDQVWQLS